jgi:hypothetical protein
MWCGVVWCGVVWCGVARRGTHTAAHSHAHILQRPPESSPATLMSVASSLYDDATVMLPFLPLASEPGAGPAPAPESHVSHSGGMALSRAVGLQV